MSQPRVVIDPRHVVKEGWLEKQSRALKRWKKRWCVVQDCYLFTYADEKGYLTAYTQPTEIIDLRTHRCDANSNTSHRFPKLTFQLTAIASGALDFPLAVLKEKEKEDWIAAITRQTNAAKAATAQQH